MASSPFTEPMAKISCVVIAGFRRDSKVAAKERRPDFGDEFFEGIPFVAESLGIQCSVQPAFVHRGMDLMPISA